MTWNYRVFREADTYFVRETYYDAEGKVKGWTTNPIALRGDDGYELLEDMNAQYFAMGKPTLEVYIDADGAEQTRELPSAFPFAHLELHKKTKRLYRLEQALRDLAEDLDDEDYMKAELLRLADG